MTEGNVPCSAIFLGGLPKMEASPSLVGGRLVLDDVDVGELREVGEDVVRPKVKMP